MVNLARPIRFHVSSKMNRRAFDPRPWPLGYPVDKQIADLVVAQVPLGERLVNLPQAFPNL
jgi:hypothetical protein